MALTGRRLTLDEFLALPEEEPALEYLDGVVTPKVSPSMHHGRIQSVFAGRVNAFGEPRLLAMAVTEVRVTFYGPRWSPLPDVGVYRWARIPRQPDGKLDNGANIPWDIAVEVVSPEQSRAEQETKCRRYLANGVEIALMIDPEQEDVVRFGADGSRVELRGDDRIDLESVLPGFVLTPAQLFASLYPG
jgi:Uma2 family endonuclease